MITVQNLMIWEYIPELLVIIIEGYKNILCNTVHTDIKNIQMHTDIKKDIWNSISILYNKYLKWDTLLFGILFGTVF